MSESAKGRTSVVVAAALIGALGAIGIMKLWSPSDSGVSSSPSAAPPNHANKSDKTGAQATAPTKQHVTEAAKPTSKAALKTAQLGSLPPLAGPLASKIPELENLANGGDASAALNLWYGLEQCKSVISQSQSNFLKNGDPASVKMFAPKISELLDNCKDVTADQISQEYKWLKQSASLGNTQAQYFYSLAGTDAVGGIDEALRNPTEWQEYRDTAENYLDSLAQQCSQDAIGHLAYMYQNGNQIFAADAGKAYMYQLITFQITPGITPDNQRVSLSFLEKNLSSDGISSATAKANEFVANYCN